MFFTEFFAEGWAYFYKVALTIINKCKEQLLKNDYTEKLFDIDKINVGGFPLAKLFKGKKKTIWTGIMEDAKKCKVNLPVFEALWKSFNPALLRLEAKVDMTVLSEAFVLP